MSWLGMAIIGAVAGVAIALGKIFMDSFARATKSAAVNEAKTQVAKQEAQDAHVATQELVKHVDTPTTVKAMEQNRF